MLYITTGCTAPTDLFVTNICRGRRAEPEDVTIRCCSQPQIYFGTLRQLVRAVHTLFTATPPLQVVLAKSRGNLYVAARYRSTLSV